MRVFVAGATRVLGRLVVRELVLRGHIVSGLARSSASAAILLRLGALPAPGDLFDAESLIEAAAGAEVVLHLAAATPCRLDARLRDWRLNDRLFTEGTANLLEAAGRARARFYLQRSAVAVHGNAGENWVDEGSPVVPRRIMDSAATAEQLVREAGQLHGLPAAILRAGTLYHPESRQTQQMIAGIRNSKRPVFGMGANFWSLVHAHDLAHAYVLAAEAQHDGETFLVVDDEPVRWRDLFTHIARAIGAPRPRYLPLGLARIVAGGVTTDQLTASLRCRNGKLKRHLGWQPRYPTYQEGFAALLAAPAAAV